MSLLCLSSLYDRQYSDVMKTHQQNAKAVNDKKKLCYTIYNPGHAVALLVQALRSTSRKVAGSIPDGVTENFHLHNPSGRTMALGLTQPLTEMSTRNISWG